MSVKNMGSSKRRGELKASLSLATRSPILQESSVSHSALIATVNGILSSCILIVANERF